MNNKVESLIIRACKSRNSAKRLEKIYKKFYYGHYDCSHMANILLGIVEKYDLIRISQLVNDLDPNKRWHYGLDENSKYYDHVCCVLVSVIRLSSVDQFGSDFIKPCKFKD